MKTLCVLVCGVLAGIVWLNGESQSAQFAARARQVSSNNLKQIALAMHNHHDANRGFPAAAIFSSDGKPLLSWRVAILPYLEQQPLFQQFKLDEPWDSEHNKKLLANMPKIYAPVQGEVKDKESTFYQVFVGKGAGFEGRKGQSIAQFADGTSNTILVVEAGTAVPWTKPEDLTYEADKPLPKLGGLFDGSFHAALADGSVHFFMKGTDEKKLRALITRNGGEVISD